MARATSHCAHSVHHRGMARKERKRDVACHRRAAWDSILHDSEVSLAADRPGTACLCLSRQAFPSRGVTRHQPVEESPVIRTLSAAAARDLATKLLGASVDDATQVPSFAGNQVFRIRRNGLVAFLKLADGSDLQRELAVLRLLGPLGLPVPEIEADDANGNLADVPCAVFRKIDGRPVSGAAAEFPAAAPMHRQVHEVTLGGFGSVSASDGRLRGEDPSWADTIERRIEGLEPIAAAGLVDAKLLDRAVATVENRRELLDTPHGGRLLLTATSIHVTSMHSGAGSLASSTGAMQTAVIRPTTSGASCIPQCGRTISAMDLAW
jgi:Phosphotransferase enzyme family